jgi:hypothetical protein
MRPKSEQITARLLFRILALIKSIRLKKALKYSVFSLLILSLIRVNTKRLLILMIFLTLKPATR